MSLIKLTDIRKQYVMGESIQKVLHGISIEVEKGEMVALMGASGSGKSTLMNIIGLLDGANSGHYLLNGRDVSKLSDDERAAIRNEMIGFVFQQFYLLSKLTAVQNVALPLTYRNTPAREAYERSMVMLDKVGMKSRSHHKPNELSGGQQQRVALARALVGDPSVILADEPTGALDSKTGREVMDLFLELHREQGSTLIIVTHDPDVGAECERIIMVRDGLVVKD